MRAYEEEAATTRLTKCPSFYLTRRAVTATVRYTETPSLCGTRFRKVVTHVLVIHVLHKPPRWEHKGFQGLNTLTLTGDY